MRVRAAGPDDVEALVALEQHALGDDAWSPGLVGEGVRGALPTVRWLLAEELGQEKAQEPVGHAVVSLAGDVAELQRIGVAAAHRRRGVARLLLDEVLVLAAAGGAERVLLEVRDDNAVALGFYAATGFAEVGRRPRYYRDGATALVLARDLADPALSPPPPTPSDR